MNVKAAEAKRIHTLSVLILALLMRLLVLGYVLVSFPKGWLFTRGVEMRLLADSLLHGQGLSSPFGVPTGPTAMIAPAYPIFLAAIFRLCGSASLAACVGVIGVHILVNMLTVLLVLRIARRIADERSALLVGIFWACSPSLIWMPTILWETSFSACLLIGFVAIACELKASTSRLQWIACGVYCGVAGLINPALLLCLVGMGTIAACKIGRSSLAKASVALVTAVIVFSPWPIRNAVVFHAFIPTRSTIGFELWMGNRPGATGYLEESFFPTFNAAELSDYKTRGEVGYAAHKSGVAKDYICSHPQIFLRMTLKRIVRFWSGSGTRLGPIAFLLHATLTTALGGFGLLLLQRSRPGIITHLLVVPIVLFPLPYYVTHAEFRYRLVIDPVMTALSAVALQYCLNNWPPNKEDLQNPLIESDGLYV